MRVIDMHCDTIWKLMKDDNISLEKNQFHVDIEKMKTAGSMAQFFACFIHMDEVGDFTKGFQRALQMIERGKQEFSNHSADIAFAKNYKDMQQHLREGKISAFLTIEEGGILEDDLQRVDALYGEGISLITLLWNRENCIGFPNSRDKKIMQSGLKSFGFEVVRRMNELGMIIDVSHLSDGSFWDVIKYSNKPVVASHSNARSLCVHPRNLSDEMIRALSERGGVAGINFYPYFLNQSGNAGVTDIVRHVEHMYRVGGEDVVAIGTDFDGFDDGISEIAHIGEMIKIYNALKKRGFTECRIDKIFSGNVIRVVRCT